jgi:hypothetical protein
MEQLIVIQILDNGEVNHICEIKVDQKFAKIKNKEIVRRHLNKFLSILLGQKVKAFYRLKECKDE